MWTLKKSCLQCTCFVSVFVCFKCCLFVCVWRVYKIIVMIWLFCFVFEYFWKHVFLTPKYGPRCFIVNIYISSSLLNLHGSVQYSSLNLFKWGSELLYAKHKLYRTDCRSKVPSIDILENLLHWYLKHYVCRSMIQYIFDRYTIKLN